MQKMLKFLDYAGIDPQLYWRVASSGQEYEIQWHKDRPLAWRFRRVGDLFWQLCRTEDLETTLLRHEIDLVEFQRKLRHTILQQLAFADRIISEGKQIFGQDAVEQAISENHRFLRQLEDVILQVTRNQSDKSKMQESGKPLLRLISDNESGASRN